MLVHRPRPAIPARATAQRAPAQPRDLTRLSWPRAGRTAIAARFRHAGLLARRSLWTLAIAVSTPGCLVTSDPVSYEPEPTPPILLTSGLEPDPRRVHLLGDPSGVNVLDIKASVLSEDAGKTVKAALLIDYGYKNVLGQPFRFILQSFPELPASTLGYGPRELEGISYYLYPPLDPGCHRLTLVVTHEFDTATGCPKRLVDSDQVTWQFIRCSDDGSCPSALDDCPPIEASCPEAPSSGTAGAADAATGG